MASALVAKRGVGAVRALGACRAISSSAKSTALAEREDGPSHMLAPFTAQRQADKEPALVLTKGHGIYLWDKDGKKYLDALAGLWCNSLGNGNERLADAAAAQTRKLSMYHSFWHRTVDVSQELATAVVQRVSATVPGMSHAFFTSSGSEANDTQIKLIWYMNNALDRPEKKKIIARVRGYHGSAIMSGSLSGLPPLHKGFDLPIAGILHTDCPHHWRVALPGESEEDFSTRLAENLEKLILREGPETIAAFIGEPVMGAGGVVPPPATYWDKIQPILKKYDILFIADEVISGFGRMGTYFASEMYNLDPDMMTLAKALSSGYQPIGAAVVKQHVADGIAHGSRKLGVFSHGFTYSGHPIPCAVALEALKIYDEINVVGKVRAMAPKLQDGLRKACEGSPIVGEVRGVGLVAAVEFVSDFATKKGFTVDEYGDVLAGEGLAGFFSRRAMEHGLLVRAAGDILMFSPQLTISDEEMDELLSKFSLALKATTDAVVAYRKSNGL